MGNVSKQNAKEDLKFPGSSCKNFIVCFKNAAKPTGLVINMNIRVEL
jgi:hypothetical protein